MSGEQVSNARDSNGEFHSLKYLSKIGHIEGVAHGKKYAHPGSYNTGFYQGLKFGMVLGASYEILCSPHAAIPIRDPKQFNCQLCLEREHMNQSIAFLFTYQEEKNYEVIRSARGVRRV